MAQFTIPARNETKEMRYQMGYALADLANEYPDIVAVDADLRSSSGLHIFEHFHPDKLVKAGIAGWLGGRSLGLRVITGLGAALGTGVLMLFMVG